MRFCDARRILAVALLLSQGACSVWTPVPGTALAPRLADAGVVRLTRDDYTRVVVHKPHVVGDSVLGWTGRLAETDPRPVSVPVARVVRVERRHVSPGRTALAVVGVGVVALIAVVGVVAAAIASTPQG